MSVRASDLVFRAGGAVFDAYGVARARTSPSEDVKEVFTRASKALYWDKGGVLRQAANDVLRLSWEDRDNDGVYETPTIPLSAALTQLVKFAIPSGTDMPALAGAGGAVGVATTAITTPTAEGIADVFDPGISTHGQNVVALFTGASGTQTRRYRFGADSSMNGLVGVGYYSMTIGVYLKATSTITPANVKLRYIDNQAGAVAGAPMTAKGRWQWLTCVAQVDIGATAAYFELQVEDGFNFANADQVVYFALPTIVAGRVLPYPIANDTGSTVTQAVESCRFDYLPQPQPCTVYVKFRERGTVHNGDSQRLFEIGALGEIGPSEALLIYSGVGYYAYHSDGAATVTSGVAVPSLGDLVELRMTFTADGRVQLFQSLNGGAETSYTISAPLTPKAAWGKARIYLNSTASGGNTGWNSFDDVKVALGNGYSMDDMRAVAA